MTPPTAQATPMIPPVTAVLRNDELTCWAAAIGTIDRADQ